MDVNRRKFVKTVAAAGSVLGVTSAVGTVGAAQQGGTIELIGNTTGWEGVAPGNIAGQTNPTLSLEAGGSYTVRWENGDGVPHNFAVRDASGNTVVSTEQIAEGTQTATIEATADLDGGEYLCEPHPGTMSGAITVTGGAPDDGGGEEPGDDDPADEPADDHGDDADEPADDHGNDADEPADDHGDDADEPADDTDDDKRDDPKDDHEKKDDKRDDGIPGFGVLTGVAGIGAAALASRVLGTEDGTTDGEE